MSAATIIVHPSKFEGKSIALDEAKILGKPVVVTDFSTVHDQFKNKYNGTIVTMDAAAVATAIEELLLKPELAEEYRKNLLRERIDNSGEIKKLYDLLH